MKNKLLLTLQEIQMLVDCYEGLLVSKIISLLIVRSMKNCIFFALLREFKLMSNECYSLI